MKVINLPISIIICIIISYATSQQFPPRLLIPGSSFAQQSQTRPDIGDTDRIRRPIPRGRIVPPPLDVIREQEVQTRPVIEEADTTEEEELTTLPEAPRTFRPPSTPPQFRSQPPPQFRPQPSPPQLRSQPPPELRSQPPTQFRPQSSLPLFRPQSPTQQFRPQNNNIDDDDNEFQRPQVSSEAALRNPPPQVRQRPQVFEKPTKQFVAQRTDDAIEKRPRKPVAQVVRKYRDDNADGSITWGFENDDGTYKEETIGNDCVTRGKYGYIDPDGVKREYTYSSGLPCDRNKLEQDEAASNNEGYIDYSGMKYVKANGESIDLEKMVKNRARRPVNNKY